MTEFIIQSLYIIVLSTIVFVVARYVEKRYFESKRIQVNRVANKDIDEIIEMQENVDLHNKINSVPDLTSIDKRAMTRAATPSPNIQMNLGSGKITAQDSEFTNINTQTLTVGNEQLDFDNGESEYNMYGSVATGNLEVGALQNYFQFGQHRVIYGSFKLDSDKDYTVNFTKSFSTIPLLTFQRFGYTNGDKTVTAANPFKVTTSGFTINRPDSWDATTLIHFLAMGKA